jgi:Kef-type K+ transport system membrane component KefB
MVLESAAMPLSGTPLLLLLVQLATILLLALALGRLAARVGLPPVVGELSAGVILGPSLLGFASPGLSSWLLPADPNQMHLLEAVGQVGLLLLVGLAGSHLNVATLRRRAGTVARVSGAGLLIPLTLGVGIGLLLPHSLIGGDTRTAVFASFLGVAMAVSAIPVIAKTLSDMRLLHRDIGQLALAAGFIDDAVAWLLLSVVSAAATIGLRADRIGLSVLYLVGFLVLAATVGRPLVRVVLRCAARSTDAGPVIVTTVLIVLGSSAAALALGLEPVFGAFVAGALIGLPSTLDQRLLAPLQVVVMSVLAPVFLALAGLRVNLSVFADGPVLLSGLAILAVAVLGKFAGAYFGARTSRLNRWEAVALGAGMNARGVVEIIIATVGLRIGVLNTASYSIVVLVAVATSLMAPPILRWSMRRVEQTADERLRLSEREPMSV